VAAAEQVALAQGLKAALAYNTVLTGQRDFMQAVAVAEPIQAQ
jgi:hypothetical protein